MTIDHIVPRWVGGTTTLSNLQTMCSRCNGKKGGGIPNGARVHFVIDRWVLIEPFGKSEDFFSKDCGYRATVAGAKLSYHTELGLLYWVRKAIQFALVQRVK